MNKLFPLKSSLETQKRYFSGGSEEFWLQLSQLWAVRHCKCGRMTIGLEIPEGYESVKDLWPLIRPKSYMLFAFLPFFSCQSTFRLKFFLLSLPPSLPSFFLGFAEHTLGQSVSCKIGGLEYWLLQTEAYLQTEEGSDFVFNVFKESTFLILALKMHIW